MTVQLSSLRVTADFDASGYARGMAQKVSADEAGIASSVELGAALAKQDVAADASGGAVGRLSKTFIDGYGASGRFYGNLASLQRQMELGNVDAARAAAIYGGMVTKFGMTADAAEIAAAGNTELAAAVAKVNAVTAQSAVEMAAAGEAAHVMAEGEGEAALASAAVTRELIVLGREGLVGNFSRLPGSILALNERLQSTGTSVLSLSTLLRILGSLAATIFNPLVLGIIAFTVAIEAIPRIFGAISSAVGSADDVLKKHDDAIKAIKGDWDAAAASAAQYGQRAQTAIQFSGSADKLRLTLLEQQQQRQIANTLQPVPLQGDPNSDFNRLATTQAYIDKYGVLAKAVQTFAEASAQGKGDVLAFNEQIGKIALADTSNTALMNLAIGLLDMTKDATAAANALKDTNDQVAKFDARFRTSEGAAEASSLNTTANALSQAQRDREAQLLGVSAVTPQQKADAARAAVLAKPQDYATDPTGSVRAYQAETAALVAYQQAATKAGVSTQKTFDDAIRSQEKDTAALRARSGALDLTAGAAAELEAKQKLLNVAVENHHQLSTADVANINAVAKAYGDATTELQKMQDAQQAQQFFAQSLFDAVSGATSLSDAFGKLANSIAHAVAQGALLGTGPLAGLFGTSASGNSGGVLGQIIGGVFGIGGASSVHGIQVAGHATGGMVGIDGTMRYVHPAYFDNAAHFDTGGMISDGGVPIVAHPGEGIFTPAQMRALSPAAPAAPIINIINQVPGAEATTKTSKGPNGQDLIEIVVANVKQRFAGGEFDKPMRRYGAKPARSLGG